MCITGPRLHTLLSCFPVFPPFPFYLFSRLSFFPFSFFPVFPPYLFSRTVSLAAGTNRSRLEWWRNLIFCKVGNMKILMDQRIILVKPGTGQFWLYLCNLLIYNILCKRNKLSLFRAASTWPLLEQGFLMSLW